MPLLTLQEIFILFFVTLGPLKVIPVFFQLTRESDVVLRQTVAWRAFWMSTAIAFAIGIGGNLILTSWQVNRICLALATGLIFFFQSFQAVIQRGINNYEPPEPTEHSPRQGPARIALFPMTIPAIITAPGVAAIILLVDSASSLNGRTIVFVTILSVLILNLLSMLGIKQIIKFIPLPILATVGWVFGVLQAALATQIILHQFQLLGVIANDVL